VFEGREWEPEVSERQSEREKKGRSKREKRVRKRKLCEISKMPMPHKGCMEEWYGEGCSPIFSLNFMSIKFQYLISFFTNKL
jgi:hypothetical protein